ncbi:cytochrome c [Vibrio sp. T187]|uniref:c-type cytochrome n=1 Tax=Vibrio TaxID=662 RepID=UPI0010C9788E|nr:MULTISPECIES: c-type cytochrome [Vibrio]MBW3695810.1 cytochrome c [Vibrio sp. T187]
MKPLLTALIIGSTFFASTGLHAANLSNGETQFKTLCVSCHGDLGHGDGIAGKSLPEQPSNIYDGLTSFWESESELTDTVLNGNEGMPAWGSILNESDVQDIFAYVLEINK